MEHEEQKTQRRPKRYRKKRNGPAIAFFIALGLLTALAWSLPLRPAVSEKEKRNLEKFPAFSLTALADGSYFNQIGVWFSDTFPGRDTWISADQRLKALHGTNDVVIYGAVDAGDDIPLCDAETQEKFDLLSKNNAYYFHAPGEVIQYRDTDGESRIIEYVIQR